MADYIYTMEIRLTPDQQRGVTLVQDIARAAGMNVYLTGGAVRDIISGFPIRDLDFSVQGNPLKLQKDLEKGGVRIAGIDDDFKTLYLGLPGNVLRCRPRGDAPGSGCEQAFRRLHSQASGRAYEMTAEEMRKAFLARWIPYGMNLLGRAEALGVDWQNTSLEKLETAVVFAEAFATPDEYKQDFDSLFNVK